MKDITSFHGSNRFLSNFWPCNIVLDGEYYWTVEHAYQAAKTLELDDRKRVQKASTPGQAKALGRHLVMRIEWDVIKLRVMTDLVWQKFSNNPDLRKKLLDTKSARLVEGNTWGDTFWGVCNGVGENHLGDILMRTRTMLRSNP